MRRFLLLTAAIVGLICGSERAWGQGATVTMDPYGAPGTTTFPAGSPPGDLKPGESADATADVDIDATDGVTFVPVGTGTHVKITEIKVKVTGHTNIRLPDNANSTLTAHENGHDTLFKYEYDNFAQKKVKAALDSLVGKEFDTQQAAEDAFNAALDAAKAAVKQQMQALADKYDKLTAHGTSTTVNSAQGVQKTEAERNAATQNSTPTKPSTTQPNAQGQGHSSVSPTDHALQLTDPQGLSVPASFTDPLNTRGILFLQPPIVIGQLPDGNTLLSDAHLQILDRFTNQPLLDGFYFGPEIMPSTLPEFPFMMQGYVDIPPDFAGGINNFINSPFLDQLDQAAASGNPVFLWYFTNADPTGPVPTDGLFVLGSLPAAPAAAPAGAVPEPATWAGAVIALAALNGLLRRRRGGFAP